MTQIDLRHPRLSVANSLCYSSVRFSHAKVAELADAPDLGSGTERCGGSSPPFRTIELNLQHEN